MRNKNVLLVSHDLSRSGAPVVLFWLAKFLQSIGYKVDLWTLSDGDLYNDFISINIIPLIVRNSKRAIKKQFENTCLSKTYDYIVCNTICTYKVVDVLQRFNVPTIWYIHESGFLEEYINNNKEFKKVFKNFYNLYTCSEYAANICRKYNKVSDVHIIPNSVEDTFQHYVCHKNIRFGYIGQISLLKGTDILVKSFLECVKLNPTMQLYLAGCNKSEFASNLMKQTNHIQNIHWLGQVKGKSKCKFFDSIDVFVLPSIYDSAPISLLEGLMYGKAVITTHNVGNSNLITSHNGLVIDAGNKEELIKAMQYIQDKKSKLLDMMKYSRKQYLSKATEEHQQQAIKRMLKDNAKNIPIVKTKIRYEFLEKIAPTTDTREILLCGCKIFKYIKKRKK